MGHLTKCLDAVCSQLTSHSFEVLVVDAAAEEQHTGLLRARHKDILWISTTVLNPYTSRNIGIQKSSGKVLAFLDAKCTPCQGWLDRGLTRLAMKSSVIIAGHYDVLSTSDRLEDTVYSILYLNNKKNVRRGYGVTTGNLFVPREAFEELGLFEDSYVSGNDIKWTRRAIEKGYKVTYAKEVSVSYKGQPYEQLSTNISKYVSGILMQNREVGYRWMDHNIQVMKYMSPMRMTNFKEALKYRNLDRRPWSDKWYLWALVWSLKIRMARAYFIQLVNK